MTSGPLGPSMQQQVRMPVQANSRMPMSQNVHPAMMNNNMHPAMMNQIGAPNMTIPQNHHMTMNPNMVSNHPGNIANPGITGPNSTMGPVQNIAPGQSNLTARPHNMVPGMNPHVTHLSSNISNLQQGVHSPVMSITPGMPHTPSGLPHTQGGMPHTPGGMPHTPGGMPHTPGGMPHTPVMAGMPPTPAMTPISSSSLPHGPGMTSNGVIQPVPSMPPTPGMPQTPGMPPTPGMPHSSGMSQVPNIVPSPQMVGAMAPHHPVSSAGFPTSVMLSSTAPMKPVTHVPNQMKPLTPGMNPKTPKTPQGSLGQVTATHLTSPHHTASPVRHDIPQIAPSPQATLNGNFNSPHAITRYGIKLHLRV